MLCVCFFLKFIERVGVYYAPINTTNTNTFNKWESDRFVNIDDDDDGGGDEYDMQPDTYLQKKRGKNHSISDSDIFAWVLWVSLTAAHV